MPTNPARAASTVAIATILVAAMLALPGSPAARAQDAFDSTITQESSRTQQTRQYKGGQAPALRCVMWKTVGPQGADAMPICANAVHQRACNIEDLAAKSETLLGFMHIVAGTPDAISRILWTVGTSAATPDSAPFKFVSKHQAHDLSHLAIVTVFGD